jgi:hypothetical protein
MKWRRGLLRAWALIAVFWAAGVVAFGYSAYRPRMLPEAPLPEICRNPGPNPNTVPFECARPTKSETAEEASAPWGQYLARAIIPPFVLLSLGVAINWVASGFPRLPRKR